MSFLENDCVIATTRFDFDGDIINPGDPGKVTEVYSTNSYNVRFDHLNKDHFIHGSNLIACSINVKDLGQNIVDTRRLLTSRLFIEKEFLENAEERLKFLANYRDGLVQNDGSTNANDGVATRNVFLSTDENDDNKVINDTADAQDTPKPKPETLVRRDRPSERLKKVAALVPAEIIGLYLAAVGIIQGFVTTENPLDIRVLWLVFVLCLILTPIYLYVNADKKYPYKVHIIVSTIAYLVWVFATNGDLYFPEMPKYYGALALLFFSFISGLVKLNK